MKKFFYLNILLLSITSKYSFSQSVIYTKQDSLNNFFIDIKEDQIGNYIITNTNSSQHPTLTLFNYTTTILQITPNGQPLSSITLPVNYNAEGIIYYNSNYYITGIQQNTTNTSNPINYLKIIKLNNNLQVIQSKIIDSITATSFNEFYSIKPTILNNNLYLLSSIIGTNGITLYKTDLNLNTKAKTTFANSYTFTDLNAFNNKIYTLAWDIQTPTLGSKLQVASFDTLLNITSVLSLDSITTFIVGNWPGVNSCKQLKVSIFPKAFITPVSSNKYIISGQGKVIYNAIGSTCYDDVQNIICTVNSNTNKIINFNLLGKTNGSDEIFYYGNGVSQKYSKIYHALSSGDNLSTSIFPQNKQSQVFVTKTDTSNSILWSKYIGDTMFYYTPLSVYATNDSGAIVSGIRYNYVTPAKSNTGEGFVMKLDKNGNQVFVGVKTNNGFTTNYHKCYPNPATNSLYFEFPTQEDIEIKIYDATGINIKSITSYKNQSNIDINNLLSGVYFYKATTKTNSFSGKFIKQ